MNKGNKFTNYPKNNFQIAKNVSFGFILSYFQFYEL